MVQVRRHDFQPPSPGPSRCRRLGEAVSAAIGVEHVAGAGDGLTHLVVDRGHVPVEPAVAVEVAQFQCWRTWLPRPLAAGSWYHVAVAVRITLDSYERVLFYLDG